MHVQPHTGNIHILKPHIHILKQRVQQLHVVPYSCWFVVFLQPIIKTPKSGHKADIFHSLSQRITDIT